MKKFLPVLQRAVLFRGMRPEDIEHMLGCLAAHSVAYDKGTVVCASGTLFTSIGMVLSGAVHILKDDFWGNRTILAQVGAGEIFGETYACVQNEPLGVTVQAAESTQVLFLDVRKTMTVCSPTCNFHAQLLQNLMLILAQKNLMLTKKIEHISKRTTREKLLSYLSAECIRHGSDTFDIPFNRQELADYLGVDRSAMSSTLCKLRDEGVLSFQKNQFHLLAEPE